ncbi:polyketide synthase [Xylariaceae sp. FL0804]|nr:polyketide synthase [Xylariaceae sp. FL0804]
MTVTHIFESFSPRGHEPIAIVGMGCRWPGDINGPSGFWELLRNKHTGYRKFGDHRFSEAGFCHPDSSRPGTVATEGGFLLAEDPRLFDPSFFGITPLEVETMDPSQRKLLEVVYEAFENAGDSWSSFAGSRTGVFVGNFSTDHLVMVSRDPDHTRPYASTGSSISILANRVNYIFDLLGPSVTIDTACSSSMYALHLAMTSIRNGDCDSAIVAASNCIMDPAAQLMMAKLGVLSSTSTCHTFDAAADGYARGEGFAALYLKKASDAAQGYPIRAFVRGTAINANGRTAGITHPSKSGQEAVIRKAYENAGGLPLHETSYFECHGTGTPVGDPIEVTAISNVFSEKTADDPLLLGSVKTNLGHTESASAIAGIMKVVLALEHGVIPPSVGVQTLNQNIDFSRCKVVRENTPWPAGKLRRASINSFGYGGANGHCVIDHVENVLPGYSQSGVLRRSVNGSDGKNRHANSPPVHYPLAAIPEVVRKPGAETRQLVVLPFSAHNEASLALNMSALSDAIGRHALSDIAYVLSAKRSRFRQRTFRIVEKDSPSSSLKADIKPQELFSSPSQTPKLGFVFTGQGAQWPAMGSELFQYQVFANSIRYMDHVLATLSSEQSWKIEEVLTRKDDVKLVHKPEISQTVCTALQVGLIDLLWSWNVHPSAVTGHSSGEIAAAYAAGRATAAETICAAYFRGQAVSRNTRQGAMLAVGMGREEAEAYIAVAGLSAKINIAALNSPNSMTLSGEVDAVRAVAEIMSGDGKFNRVLQTGGNAYHSPHMRPLGEAYESSLSNGLAELRKHSDFSPKEKYSVVGWTSSVHPSKETATHEVPTGYWRANLESPVRFSEAVEAMVKNHSIDAIVEIGPHPALKGPIGQILSAAGLKPYASTLRRGADSHLSMLQLAGTLFGLNASIDMSLVNAVDVLDEAKGSLQLEHGSTAVDLPPYQFKYGQVHYYESRASKEFRGRDIINHDLIGSKIPATAKLRPQWRNILRLKDLPWLGDHRLLPDPVFPAAGFIAMAVEAASRVYAKSGSPLTVTGYSLRNIAISSALRIPEDDFGVEVGTSLEYTDEAASSTKPSWLIFTIGSYKINTDDWTTHCTGKIKVEIGYSTPEKTQAQMDPRGVNMKMWYKTFSEIGLGYGPVFRGLSDTQADPAQMLATGKVDLLPTGGVNSNGKPESSYAIHPAALDTVFQLGLIACYGGQAERARTAYVPFHINRMYLKAGTNDSLAGGLGTATAKGELRGMRGAYARLQMVNKDGQVILDVPQLRCISYSGKSAPGVGRADFSAPLMRLSWIPDVRTLGVVQAKKLFPPPEENADKAYLLDIFERLAALKDLPMANASQNIALFLSWVRRWSETDETQWAAEAKALPSPRRQRLIDQLFRETEDCADVKVAERIFANINDILYERRTGIDVGITMTALGNVQPHHNILEVGAGTGGATRIVMKALASEGGFKRYSKYTFTDISSGAYRDMEFAVLNIENDPLSVGFEPVYDVVIASECLHATASIAKTLQNCRRLLKPSGKLIIVENTRTLIGHGLVLGTLTGYWDGIADGRIESPFLTLEGWTDALVNAGFSKPQLVLEDYPAPYTTACTIVSEAVIGKADDKASTKQEKPLVHLVYQESESRLLAPLKGEMERRGIDTKTLQFAHVNALPAGARVVAFLEDDFLTTGASNIQLQHMQELARNVSSLACITCCGLAKGRNPTAAVAAGLLRTIGAENPTSRFLFIDIDPSSDIRDANLSRSICDQELLLQQEESGMYYARDREFAWQDGCLWASRVVPDHTLSDHIQKAQSPPSDKEMLAFGRHGPVRAAFETPGILSSLYFKPYEEMMRPLPDDFIQVKVAAVGLNWKDLAISAGRFDMNNYSSEFSGIVDSVGKGVMGLSPGDRVYGMGKGHFGNYVRTPARLAQRMQPSDDFIMMATMPLVYMTALYAFCHATQVKPGEKVLIQSATGGLGLAAIQLARSQGAQIFATVGSADKVQYLVNKIGIPASRIFSSHNLDDIPKLLAASGGRGFNVVLGTATSDNLHESLSLVAPLGRYIDVGRVDVQNSMTMGLEVFQKSATFSSFDLGVVMDSMPEMGRILMESLDQHYRQGKVGPVNPVTTADVSQLDRVLLDFSKGTHIGKKVITFQDPDVLVPMVPPVKRLQLDPRGIYIVTGGLGGLGRSIIRWMAECGGRYFAVLSRRGASSPEAQDLIAQLAAGGVTVRAIKCDVSIAEDVNTAIPSILNATTASSGIKGIVHAAVSYYDLSFDKLTASQWKSGLAAKVQGTQNLHKAMLSHTLDFFVMTTSAECVVSLATQSAYTAANNFQEVFARYRRSLGLPASTASFGLITDIGSLSTNNTTLGLMARNKVLGITTEQFLQVLELALLNNSVGSPSSSPVDNGSSGQDEWTGAKTDPLSGANILACFDPRAMAARERERSSDGGGSGPTPRWYSDARVAQVMRTLEDAERHFDHATGHGENQGGDGGKSSAPANLRRKFHESIEATKAKSDSATEIKGIEDMVSTAITTTVAQMLFIDASTVDASRTVADYGIDSLIAAELRNWLNIAFGVDISMLELLDTRVRMRDLAGTIVSKAIAVAEGGA